jgi:2-dehydro-3-deoxyphosphooctonate aldolase (KDO 8-P synthase)
VLPLAKAAVAVGVAAIFVEVHKNPQKALSVGANSIDLRMFKNMLDTVCKLDKAVK